MKRLILPLLFISLTACEHSRPVEKGSWKLCPEPRALTLSEEVFVLDRAVCIQADQDLRPQAALLQDLLEEYTLMAPRLGEKGKCIVLQVDESLGADLQPFQREECYRIRVSARRVELAGGSTTGVLRGIYTLLKGLPARPQARQWPALEGGEIFDYPQFDSRAFILDCGRHILPLESIKKVIDVLALHQLNRFHWRQEDTPELTELVAYAADRGIRLIPETDFPGQMTAALALYPQLDLSEEAGNQLQGDAYFRQLYDLDIKPGKDGVSACLRIGEADSEEDLLWKILPRLGAVAELQWADPALRHFGAFLPRLYKMEEIYSARGWNWNEVQADLVYTDASAFPLYGKAVEETSARYQRFPSAFRETARPPLWSLSENSAGLYLRFRSDAPSIHARWTNRAFHMPHMTDVGVGGLDLYARLDGEWRFVGSGFNWGDIRKQHEKRLVGNMDAQMREYMLYLPLYDCLDSLFIGIPKGYALQRPELLSPRSDGPVVMYGTSILQGGCASRPGMAHTAILSRALDREVINLGFSGNAFLDTEIATLISRVHQPSLIVLDYVPNASADKIQSYGETFFRIIREAHPEVPVVFVEDPLFPHSVVDKATWKEVTKKNRAQKALYLKLKEAGTSGIYYVPAEGMLGDDGEATVDGYHLTDLGMMRYVDHILPILRKAMAI